MRSTFAFLICVLASGTASAADQSRIIGGSGVNITHAPYQVSVQYNNVHRCGGAVLTEEYTVSAASCLYDVSTVGSTLTFTRLPSTSIRVRLGTSYTTQNGSLHTMEKAYHHPKFDITIRTGTLDYDIAILKSSSYVTLRDTVERVLLPTPGTNWLFETGVYMTGWGSSSWTSTALATHLQGVKLKLLDSQDCSLTYGRNYTSRMICVGVDNYNQGPWVGDFGGPLVLASTDYGTNELMGVLSYASSGGPSVFINVAHLEIHEFLYEIIYNSDDN